MFEKLDMKTINFTDDNIKKIAEIFPNVVSEDENGKVIDFEALKQELSGNIVEGYKERYSLNWPGKREAQLKANTPTTKTLRPSIEESVNFDTTENLYIEGDNLDVLKILQEGYLNKIKMIYIDPPYNTGKDFIYNDNFTRSSEEELLESGQIDEDGGKLVANPETNGKYHSDWLSMMYPRLKLARNLLKENGVIFISIDDNEVHNLRKVCDEIFGEHNFISQMPWQARQSIQNDTDLSSSHEYIVAYGKIRRQTNRRLKESNKQLWYQEKSFACYPIPLDKSKFSNPDNDPRGLWKADPFDAPNIRPNLTYPIINPNTNESHMPPNGRCWRTEEKNYQEWLADNRIIFGKTGDGRPQLKVFYEEKKEFGSVSNTWLDGNTYGTATKGTKLLQTLFQNAPFDTPKPIELIQQLMLIGIKENDIVLDFFSGSATTAHSVMKLNSEDDGNRKFIMVQLPEKTNEKSEANKAGYKTIPEIGKERIRRAGKKIVEESGKTDLDIGFRVLKLDSSNIKDVYFNPNELSQQNLFDTVDNIKEDRSDLDLLFGVLIDWGVDLTLPINKEVIQEKDCYFVDSDSLCAYFGNDINEEFIKELAKKEALRFVFKDSSFGNNDDLKDNVSQIFKQLNPQAEIKVI